MVGGRGNTRRGRSPSNPLCLELCFVGVCMWLDEAIEILRVFLNDLGETTYTDDTLERILLVAARQVNIELNLDYTVSITGQTITPDPGATDTRNETFIDLMCLKAACITDHNAAIVAANRAIAIRDGSSAVDLRGILSGKLKLLEAGWCKVYEDAVTNYIAGDGSLGVAIVGPFRNIAGYGYTGYERRW